MRYLATSVGVLVLALTVSATGVSGASLSGTTLYVDRGNPACSNTLSRATVSVATPWCSLAPAGALAQPGDVVHVARGTYPGTFAPTVSGVAGAQITFVADGAVTLTSTVKLVHVANLVLDGFAVSGASTQGVWLDGSANVVLSDLTVTGSAGYGVMLKGTSAVTVSDSSISTNGAAGVFETAASTGDSILRNSIVGNGHDGLPYNGDGIQLAGAGTLVAGNTITGNGDPGPYEHGIYAATTAVGYLIERNVLSGNAASDIKAAGSGTVRYNRLGDALFGLVLSDDTAPVWVYENLIVGSFQHAVLATTGKTPSQAAMWNNTIVQTGRSTTAGSAATVMVLSTTSLDIRNNIICYTNPDDLGVALFINSATTVSGFSSNNNWLCDTDRSGRTFAWNGSRATTAQWTTATGLDGASVVSAPPTFDPSFRVTSANLGAGKGQSLGLIRDFAGTLLPAAAPDIGAYQALPG
jgi:parallel beta-helix repeat protein